MAITDKKTGPWGLDQVYNKINQGSIWDFSQSGELWANGENEKGDLGQNNQVAYSSPVQVGSESTWSVPESDSAAHRKGDGAGTRALFIKTDGTLWAWGSNDHGRLGLNEAGSVDRSSPVQLGSDTDWKTVASNSANTKCGGAIKTDGTLWTWGENDYGNLGLNDHVDYSSPVQIPGTTWTQVIVAMDGSSAGLKSDGTLYTWGYNHWGQMGNNESGPTSKYSSPVQVPGTTWKEIAGGYRQVGAIKTDGTLWTFGSNAYGQLAQNDQGGHPAYNTSRSSPVQVPGTTWKSIKSGNNWFSAIKTDGTLWAWGYNGTSNYGGGALGQNNVTSYSSPVQIPGTTWDYIDNGPGQQYAIKTDGTYWAWGDARTGSLGHNAAPTSHRSSPIQIPGSYAAVTAGTGSVFPMKYS